MAPAADIEALKAQGNTHYAAGGNAAALECYCKAVEAAGDGSGDGPPILHILHSNASAAAARLGRAEEALRHARRCVELAEDWPKGYVSSGGGGAPPGRGGGGARRGLKRCPADGRAPLQHELDRLLQEDGDQRPLKGFLPGTPAQDMRDFQGEQGLKMHGPAALGALACDALRYAFLGEEDKFRAAFKPVEHLHLRSWPVKLPICSLIVSGAQRVQYVTDRPTGAGHAAILRHVCELGARVDARDIAGYTALAHATGHAPELELARVLLEFGADPGMPTRFGSVPLHSAVMAGEVEAVELLLEAGADPKATDLYGVSVEQLARHNPTLLALVHKAQGKHQENAHVQKGSACFNCGKAGATRRCEGCLAALYCSRNCQRAHWKAHKGRCGKPASDSDAAGGGGAEGSSFSGGGATLRVKPSQAFPYVCVVPTQGIVGAAAQAMGVASRGGGIKPGPIMGPEEQAAAASGPSHQVFTVKVQVPLNGGPGMPMLIYNKARTFRCHVEEGSSSDAARLAALVRTKGMLGQKAYLSAYSDAASGELVLSEAMLPTQPW